MTYTLIYAGRTWKLDRPVNRHSLSYTQFIQGRLTETVSPKAERLVANWIRFVSAR